MTSMIGISLRCPCCSNEFESRALASTNNLGPFHTDFRQEAAGFQPRQFYIHGCPRCGFSGYEQDFEGPVDDATRAKIADGITPDLGRGKAAPWQTIERAAQIYQWKKMSSYDIAMTYLLAAYVCADCRSDAASEKANRAKAIEFYTKAMDENIVPSERVPETVYLVGELYRRIGQKDKAAEWLARAEDMARAAEGLQDLADLARQQRTEPRETIPR